MTKITIRQIKNSEPDSVFWERIVNWGEKFSTNEKEFYNLEISLQQLINIVGVLGVVWCLRCLPENRKQDIINFIGDCSKLTLASIEAEYDNSDKPDIIFEMTNLLVEYFKLAKESPDVSAAALYGIKACHVCYRLADVESEIPVYKKCFLERERQVKLLIKYFGDGK